MGSFPEAYNALLWLSAFTHTQKLIYSPVKLWRQIETNFVWGINHERFKEMFVDQDTVNTWQS